MKPKLRGALVVVGIAGALFFAVEGGEYGTTDLLRQRWGKARLQAQLDLLRREVDSLRAYRRRLDSDPKLQEKIAREEFGMVKPGEVLYRYVDER